MTNKLPTHCPFCNDSCYSGARPRTCGCEHEFYIHDGDGTDPYYDIYIAIQDKPLIFASHVGGKTYLFDEIGKEIASINTYIEPDADAIKKCASKLFTMKAFS